MRTPGHSITLRIVAFVLIGAAGSLNPAFAGNRIRADFNGDGIDDLAIGVPGEKGSSGGVNIIYGSNAGLTTTGNQFFSQAGDVPDVAEANDNCGAAVAAGDFDGDGFADLAMGCPGEDLGTSEDMGAVNILYGSANGLTVAGSQFFGFTDVSASDLSFADKCATALATGDFNHDGRDDLAIGCPGREFGMSGEGSGVFNAGRVVVLFGASTGLTATGRRIITQATAGVPGTPEGEDMCGSALAAGDFNNDGFADLAIGCPGEDVSDNPDLGGVNLVPGSASGPTGAGSTFFSFADLVDEISGQDRCGSALAAGNFNGDPFDDLAMGCPGRDVGVGVEGGGAVNAGRVVVLNGSAAGITAAGRLSLTQNSAGIPDSAEANDNCGAALTTGDFNGDGFVDLAMGCPNEDVGGAGGTADPGGVNVIYGSAAGLTGTGAQFFSFNDSLSFADHCSTGLAAGDFNGNAIDDLAIGCPGFDLDVVIGESSSGIFDAGRVVVLFGTANRLTTTGRQNFHQDSTGIAGTAQAGDAFGFALAGMGGFAAPGLTGAWQQIVLTCDDDGNHRRCRLSGTFVVTNPSTQSVGPTVLRFYLSSDPSLDPGDSLLSEVGVGTVKNGESATKRFNVLLPEGVDASGRFVIAFVDADDVVSELNEANNIVVSAPIQRD